MNDTRHLSRLRTREMISHVHALAFSAGMRRLMLTKSCYFPLSALNLQPNRRYSEELRPHGFRRTFCRHSLSRKRAYGVRTDNQHRLEKYLPFRVRLLRHSSRNEIHHRHYPYVPRERKRMPVSLQPLKTLERPPPSLDREARRPSKFQEDWRDGAYCRPRCRHTLQPHPDSLAGRPDHTRTLPPHSNRLWLTARRA